MTVPAFSLSVVLPGAPGAPAGVGAAMTGAPEGVFEGLLAGLANVGDPARAARGRLPGAAVQAVAPDEDTTPPPQDAGLALLLAAPGAAPVLTPLTQPDAPAATPDVLAARQVRLPALAPADRPAPSPPSSVDQASLTPIEPLAAAAWRDAGAADAVDPAPGAPSTPRIDTPIKGVVGLTGQTVPDVDVKAAATPAPAVQAEAARPAPAPAAPLQLPPAAPAPRPEIAPVVVAVAAAEAQVAPETPRPAPTIGDVRRAGVSRADRRADPAGRSPSAAQPAASPVRQVALAALADAIDATSTEASPATDPDVVASDVTEAADAPQPSLPGEVRAPSAQALTAAAVAAVPRGSPETVARLAADIIRKLDGQSTRFDLELNPHGMGKVDVAIEIDKAGRLTAAMTFDTAQSATDLRGRAAELRQALEQAGFSVSDGGLTFDLAGQGAGFGGRGAAQQQQDRAWNGRAFQRAQSGADEADLALNGVSPPSASWTRSGVDIRI